MDYCSYEEFGRRFFEHAVTEERILGAVAGLAGEPIEFGPIGAGPGKIAQVSASGKVGAATVRPLTREHVAFLLTIPVDLLLTINLGGAHRFRADVEVRLTITARAAEPLRVVIDVEPPTKENVVVSVRAEGLRATMMRYAASVDEEIRRFVAKYVAREIDKPKIKAARDIDVAARIDGAWQS
ncbi:hypothetical protein EV193_105223 [Herbihabitans rhizosphaerae]|uniref:Uncharacterized protein n=1 Tax=Herbihabitans rhizosphaerae TaxID=1872711 RepID=A0A4Q7KM99_9PSEU|nr:hypothetical protein [Herbihabitans rhizosphaerae]RZS37665.1 hypothetical protein EV193_105223 [Herbihabitans rhizosphaerae]